MRSDERKKEAPEKVEEVLAADHPDAALHIIMVAPRYRDGREPLLWTAFRELWIRADAMADAIELFPDSDNPGSLHRNQKMEAALAKYRPLVPGEVPSE